MSEQRLSPGVREYMRLHGHKPVKPTVRMLRYWWARLNRDCFGGRLLPCRLSFGPSDMGFPVAGCFFGLDSGRGHINIDELVDARGYMLNTLAHEMVHQWQYQHGQPLNHGSTFTHWVDPLLQHGLHIV